IRPLSCPAGGSIEGKIGGGGAGNGAAGLTPPPSASPLQATPCGSMPTTLRCAAPREPLSRSAPWWLPPAWAPASRRPCCSARRSRMVPSPSPPCNGADCSDPRGGQWLPGGTAGRRSPPAPSLTRWQPPVSRPAG
uniref:Uncharacterized protein n=1 Tax=Chrysemys picta bellii TaxID=8478 RepID=A0A8C3HC19_CHRPI